MSPGHTGWLTVDAGNPAVRIEVLDHAWRVQASDFGRLEIELPTGLYTVRYAAGDSREERDVAIRPQDAVMLDEPPDLRIRSPSPLALTATSHEYHMAAAEHLSRADPVPLGGGSLLFLFVRDVDPGGRGDPARGLLLCDGEGESVLSLAEVCERNPRAEEASWAGCNIELDPGFHRLRLELRGRTPIELPLHLMPGWQSQLFLLRQGGEARIAGRPVPDLPGATQFMVPAGMGFDSQSRVRRRMHPEEAGEDLRLAELARQALAAGDPAISREDLRAMLWGKWTDPLLGIYGLHLLLMRDDPDFDFLESVLDRLHGIVGGARHPDLDALALEIGRRRDRPCELPPFESPPMLRRGWAALVAESAHQPHLMPPGSLCDRIADRLWGNGAFLAYLHPPAPAATAGPRPAGRAMPPLRIRDLGGHLDIGGVILAKRAAPSGDFTAVPGPRTGVAGRRVKRPAVRPRGEAALSRLARRSELLAALLSAVPAHPRGPVSTARRQLESMLREAPPAVLRGALEQLLPELERRRSELSGPALERLMARARLDEKERALLLYLSGLVAMRSWHRAPSSFDPLAMPTLVRRLGLPAGHVVAAAAGLATRLAVAWAR